MWHCALISFTPSHYMGLDIWCPLFWCWVSLCVPFTNCLTERYFIMTVATIIGIFMAILLFLIYTSRLFVTRSFWFCKYATPRMFLSLDIFFEDWIEHGTFGFFHVIFRFSTRVFWREGPGLLTDCPCAVWYRWLTTCLLYVGPPFKNLIWNDSGFVRLT